MPKKAPYILRLGRPYKGIGTEPKRRRTSTTHKSVNEYNNVAFQLAQIKRVVAPLNYDGKWKVAPPAVVEGNTEDKL